ncbi:MAG: polysaccharide deacetylase family protein [Eubacterium sp.]|nr:polysaccharide deacetylase family protein [Eubacterium sp.]
MIHRIKRQLKSKKFYTIITSLALAMVLSVGVDAKDYSDYSNEAVAFGLNLREDHKRPECEKPPGVKKISKYDTYYYNIDAYKNKDKVIYLTFDCGYENGNTKAILDALKDAGVKATFFVTTPYVKGNPKLVKRMKKEGHLVGNHTTTHPRLTERSVSEIQEELNTCAETVEELTGYTMDHFMRPPEGVYSVRVMKVAQDMGYKTMLWSLAIYDYEENDQPGADYVLAKFKKHYFPGMMPLLHVISSSDAEALPDIISYFKDKGYRFGELSEFDPPEEAGDSTSETTAARETSQAEPTADGPAEETATEIKSTEDTASENPSAETGTAEGKSSEEKTTEKKSEENKSTGKKTSDKKSGKRFWFWPFW